MSIKDVFEDNVPTDQLTLTISINENVSAGDVLRAKPSGAHGFAEKANSSGSTCCGIAAQNGLIGANIEMIQNGIAKVNFVDSLISTDVGKKVYVSNTAGQATLTAPTSSGESVIQIGFLQDVSGHCLVEPTSIIIIQ